MSIRSWFQSGVSRKLNRGDEMSIRRIDRNTITGKCDSGIQVYISLKSVMSWWTEADGDDLKLVICGPIFSFAFSGASQEDLDNLVQWKWEIEESLMMR